MEQHTRTDSQFSTAAEELDLRGILLPFTTPFQENEELDLAALRANLNYWNQTGISGYVALGSTGERVNLDEREYITVIENAREEVPNELTFIVGAGQQSTLKTVNEVKTAAAAGADAVLVITPSFYRSAITPDSLVKHYTAVADDSPVPVILYSMPDLTGIFISPETVANLSQHPNIIGMKDSSPDLVRFKRTIEIVPESFAVLTGNGTLLYDALCSGARGAILAVGCVASAACLEIYRRVSKKDFESAALLQAELTPLALAVTKGYGIGGLKTALELVGLQGGSVRAPLKRPDEEGRHEIMRLLDRMNRRLSIETRSIGPVGFAGVSQT